MSVSISLSLPSLYLPSFSRYDSVWVGMGSVWVGMIVLREGICVFGVGVYDDDVEMMSNSE